MRDPRYTIFGLLAGLLVITWVYHLYDKSRYSNRLIEKVPVRDSAAIADAIRDSLQLLYSSSLDELDSTKQYAASMSDHLQNRLEELSRLKSDINTILRNRHATQDDLRNARVKIEEMRSLLSELRQSNQDLATEKQRLQYTLDQLSREMTSIQESMQKLEKENSELAKTVNLASTFILTHMEFKVVQARNRKKEQPVHVAAKADKMIFSFVVKNNVLHLPSTDVYIVVTDPIGRVMQHSIWNSGNFIVPSEGTKAYTIREHLSYEKGNNKEIIYTISPEIFFPGTYKLQVYHNGVEIGESSLKLN